MLLGDTATGS